MHTWELVVLVAVFVLGPAVGVFVLVATRPGPAGPPPPPPPGPGGPPPPRLGSYQPLRYPRIGVTDRPGQHRRKRAQP